MAEVSGGGAEQGRHFMPSTLTITLTITCFKPNDNQNDNYGWSEKF